MINGDVITMLTTEDNPFVRYLTNDRPGMVAAAPLGWVGGNGRSINMAHAVSVEFTYEEEASQ
jgi:hypothetical protein